MYSYNISKVADNTAFLWACETIETSIKDCVKKHLVVDVDGSLLQEYSTNRGEIFDFNDYTVDAVYADSEFSLESLNLSQNW